MGLRVKRVGESIEWGKGLPELHDGLLQDAADDVFCPLSLLLINGSKAEASQSNPSHQTRL